MDKINIKSETNTNGYEIAIEKVDNKWIVLVNGNISAEFDKLEEARFYLSRWTIDLQKRLDERIEDMPKKDNSSKRNTL